MRIAESTQKISSTLGEMRKLPGFHILGSTNSVNPIGLNEKRAFERILRQMRHFPWYKAEVEFADLNIILGKSDYDGYPIEVSVSEKGVTSIEGAVYNKSGKNLEEQLLDISLAGSSLDELIAKVRKFVLSADGEFIVMKYEEETGDCLIFNDALGRLPFYYCSSPTLLSTRMVMSREAKFIVPFLEKPDVDVISVAEYLLFGYSLSSRTLLRDIKRLPPATMLMINAENKGFLLKEIFKWNLDPLLESGKSTRSMHAETRDLVKLFIESARDIAQRFSKDYTHALSLSGGLDSRATLAGLCEVGINPIAFSFPSGESQIAGKIAEAFGIDHSIILSSFKISREDYVKLTDGLLDIGLSPRFSYLDAIREKVASKAILFTGDGGDKTLSPLGFKSNILNIQELLSYIIETDHVFDIDQVSSILNIDKEYFIGHLKNYFRSYPEKTMEGKFVHFKVFERGFKWLFVGEDRNRFFLWSTTPFYSIRFFRASMELPQHFKEHYILYKDFLSRLNPVLPRIRYYDRLVPLSIPNWLLKSYLTVFEWLKKHFYERGTANLMGFLLSEPAQGTRDETKNLILNLLNLESPLELFDCSKIRDLVLKEKNQIELNILATLILYSRVLKSSDH